MSDSEPLNRKETPEQENSQKNNNKNKNLSYEAFLPNKNYNIVYSWMYAICHAFGGFYFGYSMTCMNNLAKPIISNGLGATNAEYDQILSFQNLYFGIAKVVSSIAAGLLVDSIGRRNLLIMSEVTNIGSIALF